MSRKWRQFIILLMSVAVFQMNSCAPAVKVDDVVRQAQTLQAMGKAKQAEDLLSQKLKALGSEPTHALERATLLVAQGKALMADQKFAQAEPVFQEALSIKERKFGLDGVDVLDALDGLRASEAAQKKYSLAERDARRVLAIADKHYQPSAPPLENYISNVLAVACISGKCRDEVDLTKRLVTIREQVYGKDSGSARAGRMLLAEAYRHHHEFKPAVALLEQNVEASRRVAPKELIMSLNNLAHFVDLSGDYEKAIAVADEALKLEDKDQGGLVQKQMKLSTMHIKARALAEQGKNEEAAKLYGEFIDQVRAMFKNKNPHLADFLTEYSDVLEKLGRKKQAKAAHDEAEKMYTGFSTRVRRQD